MQKQIQSFLKFITVEKGYAQNTLAAYQNDLNQMAAHLEQKHPGVTWEQVSREDVSNYIQHMRSQSYSSTTVARKLAALKSFFHFLTIEHIIDENPAAMLDSPKVRKYLPKALSTGDVDRLLAEPAKDASPKGQRDRAIMETLYATGMRVTELINLNVEDINLQDGHIRCLGKGAKERIVPLYPQAMEVLQKALPSSEAVIITTMPRGSLQIVQPPRLPEPLLRSYAREFHLEDRLTWQAGTAKPASRSPRPVPRRSQSTRVR